MTDWDQAYDNRAHVGDAAERIENWQNNAIAFREVMGPYNRCRLDQPYGEKPRNRYDLFLPEGEPKGVVVYIHGGYWRALDKSFFSHLASGPLAHGWQMAVPSYTLAPDARIGEITREMASAITVIAHEHDGPIRLIGHSAGGHLVSRMHCDDNLLAGEVYDRIVNTVAVSGVFDLDPLMKTKMNEDLRLDEQEVRTESPIHYKPRENTRITCLVGGSELPEFLRHNDMLTAWKSSGARVKTVIDQGRNHFTVIEPLARPSSMLTSVLLA